MGKPSVRLSHIPNNPDYNLSTKRKIDVWLPGK
jgi:hypothetical protein